MIFGDFKNPQVNTPKFMKYDSRDETRAAMEEFIKSKIVKNLEAGRLILLKLPPCFQLSILSLLSNQKKLSIFYSSSILQIVELVHNLSNNNDYRFIIYSLEACAERWGPDITVGTLSTLLE